MTDVNVSRLRIRGEHARRLARVAAVALPGALERALADMGEVSIGSLPVTLDCDVDGCDDETLAILWAEAIRTAVLAARPGSRRSAGASAGDALPEAWEGFAAEEVLAAARTWLAAGGTGERHLPRALLALGDAATARAVAAAAGSREWSLLIAAIGEALDGPRQVRSRDSSKVDMAAPEVLAPGQDEQAQQKRGARGETSADEQTEPAIVRGTQIAPAAEVLAVLAQLADLVDAHAPAVDPAAVTRAAGVVLLYPWLAEHCRRAQELHPDLDAVEVREIALAAIVDPDDPALADDPLIRQLAGRPESVPRRPVARMPLPHRHEVAESSKRVLESFAALLPGFERSTAAFIRSSWIVRHGLVDTARDPVLLTAVTHPLDVLLPRLPYPVGLIKLPWSEPLSVRFRP